MSVVVVGLEHQRTPLDVLERATVSDAELSKTLAALRDRSNLLEVVVLSTCLRTELYAVVERFHEGVADLQEHLAASVETTVEQLAEQLTVQFDDAVVVHLFEVAAGLRSAIPGEHEVLGQVRLASERAEAERAAGPVLSNLFDRAVQAGRRVRSETSIGHGKTSLAHLSVDLVADRLAGRFGSAKVLVVGAGQMSQGVVAALRSKGVSGSDVTVLNRTIERAEAVAEQMGGSAAGLDSLAGALAEADSVIVTTSAPTPILDLETVSAALSAACGPAPRPVSGRRHERAEERRPLGGRARRCRAARHRSSAGIGRPGTRRPSRRARAGRVDREGRGRALQGGREVQGRGSSGRPAEEQDGRAQAPRARSDEEPRKGPDRRPVAAGGRSHPLGSRQVAPSTHRCAQRDLRYATRRAAGRSHSRPV